MHITKIIILFIILSFIFSCSSSYEFLSKNTLNTKDNFSKYLLKEYKSKANFEAKEMHDWNSAKLYSEKALKAVKGIKVKPEEIKFWKLSPHHYLELKKAYDNLMKVYEKALQTNPYHLAVAISSLDCWSEQQEEGWQTWDIEDCRNNYLNAMHTIYTAITNVEKNKDKQIREQISDNKNNNSVVVVTKDKKEEIMQIIYFDFDKSNLNEVNLKELKDFLKKHQEEINKYLIVGHADTKGTNKYNMNLSLERALKVQNILIQHGISNNKIKLVAMGENDLAIQTNDEIEHPANRRVEISPIN